jgi:hypothetical protein
LDVLSQAEFWRKTNAHADLEKARDILRDGFREHPYALPIGDELVLVLEKLGDDEAALHTLKDLEHRFKDAGEETLCRFGKIYKKRSDRQMAAGLLAAAFPSLEESERYYGRSFEKSRGFYPRINELTVRFVRAAVARALDRRADADSLLRDVQQNAAAMLLDPTVWVSRKIDDNIWIPATRGEANVLLGVWVDAAAGYGEAIRQAAGQLFYRHCMHGQVKLLLDACQMLDIRPEGPLTDPDILFEMQSNTISSGTTSLPEMERT